MKLIRYIGVVALAACSSAPQWEKSGADPAAAQQASDECRARARAEAPEPNVFASTGGGTVTRVLTVEEQREQNRLEYFQKCMQEKGYSAKR
jgi:hypothetical protein